MISVLFIFLIVLLSRLYFFYDERPLSFRAVLMKSGIELGAVALTALWHADFAYALFENRLLLLAVFLAALNLWAWRGIRSGSSIEGLLIIQFALLNLSFAGLINRFPPDASFLGVAGGFHFLGAIICLNEVNFLFRWLMRRLELKDEVSGEAEVDRAEYNRGRVIGMLERLLIYVMAVVGEYTAIGFVLALKAAIRFPELKNRAFAEYVLIGTLLSTVMAVGVALAVGCVAGFFGF